MESSTIRAKRSSCHLLFAIAVSALLGACVGPSTNTSERTPAAAQPKLLAVLQASATPVIRSSNGFPTLTYGVASPVSMCAYDKNKQAFTSLAGMVLRFETPYPTRLKVSVDGQELVYPKDAGEERALHDRGAGYYYETPGFGRPPRYGHSDDREIAFSAPAAAAAKGRYTVAVRSVSLSAAYTGAAAVSDPLTVTVSRCPDFALGAKPAVIEIKKEDNVGVAGVVAVAVNRIDFAAPVSLSAAARFPGSFEFAPTPTAADSRLTIYVSKDAKPGRYPVTITGVADNVLRRTTVDVSVVNASVDTHRSNRP